MSYDGRPKTVEDVIHRALYVGFPDVGLGADRMTDAIVAALTSSEDVVVLPRHLLNELIEAVEGARPLQDLGWLRRLSDAAGAVVEAVGPTT